MSFSLNAALPTPLHMPILLHVGVKHDSDVAVAFFEANVIVQGPNTTSHFVNWTGPAGLKEIESAVNSSTSPQLQGLTIIGAVERR
jgi:hypothetical protein